MPRGASPQRGPSPGKQRVTLPRDGSHKTRLKVIGRELPDIDTDEQFQANWKISKQREVSTYPTQTPLGHVPNTTGRKLVT